MSEPVHLDPTGLQRLQRLGGDAFVVKMIDLFFSYGAEKVAEAQRALAAGDLPALAKAVHPLKSSAGNVGATRMQELALLIEGLAKQGDAEAVRGLVPELEASFTAVKAELEPRRAALGIPAVRDRISRPHPIWRCWFGRGDLSMRSAPHLSVAPPFG